MPAPESFSAAHHWVLPFSASLSEPCLHALPRLAAKGALPHLRQLLRQLQITTKLEGDEYALSMPHERVLGLAMGWLQSDGAVGTDGLMPWSAWWAAHDGVQLDPTRVWGLLSPGHWLMGRDHLTLLDPQTLGLSDDESRALLEAVRDLFETDGWTLQWGAASRWYASYASLAGLPTASLDRVIGRNPDVWLTDNPQARMIRRLQSEVQMLLYQHPINDARESAGLATVNSFWLSGCGAVPDTVTLPDSVQVVDDLRAPMLADDMPLWLEAWAHVDNTALKAACEALAAGRDVKLTLCGERHAVTLSRAANVGLASRVWRSVKRLTGASPGPHHVDVLTAL